MSSVFVQNLKPFTFNVYIINKIKIMFLMDIYTIEVLNLYQPAHILATTGLLSADHNMRFLNSMTKSG